MTDTRARTWAAICAITFTCDPRARDYLVRKTNR